MQDDESVTITLTKQQLAWLNQALQELPMKIALPFVQDLNRQLAPQVKRAPSTETQDQTPTLQ